MYLVKDGHGELLVGDTVRGVAVVLVVLVRDVVVDPIQYVLLKNTFSYVRLVLDFKICNKILKCKRLVLLTRFYSLEKSLLADCYESCQIQRLGF